MKMRDLLIDAIIRKAQPRDIVPIKAVLDRNRAALGFVRRAELEQGILRGEVLVGESRGNIIGVLHYHHRLDATTTIYQVVVAAEVRRNGLGRALIKALEKECWQRGQQLLRLKCPVDLPANGFYARLGFRRMGVEDGVRRPLAVWEKPLEGQEAPKGVDAQFFITLTNSAGKIRRVVELWGQSGDPRNPFAHVIFTPLFSSVPTITEIRRLKEERGAMVMFDSGGYQVQMGKMTYEELFDQLFHFYTANPWADWYVLPDRVPHTADSNEEVEFKVQETIDFGRLFWRRLPDNLRPRALGVVHGRMPDQIRRCIEAYAEMGVRYVGFGSFGTSGPSGAVNLVSQQSLSLLRLTQALAREHDLRLHVFGIGSPGPLIRIVRAGITLSSFDSAGWWKAGAFGNVFFPKGQQLHITAMATWETTAQGILQAKEQSQHECKFCADTEQLRRSRIARIMHNLSALLDTLELVKGGI